MPKEPGEPREENFIDFSELTNEELESRIKQEEENEEESALTGNKHGEKDQPPGLILRSLQTEWLKRKQKQEGEK